MDGRILGGWIVGWMGGRKKERKKGGWMDGRI